MNKVGSISLMTPFIFQVYSGDKFSWKCCNTHWSTMFQKSGSIFLSWLNIQWYLRKVSFHSWRYGLIRRGCSLLNTLNSVTNYFRIREANKEASVSEQPVSITFGIQFNVSLSGNTNIWDDILTDRYSEYEIWHSVRPVGSQHTQKGRSK